MVFIISEGMKKAEKLRKELGISNIEAVNIFDILKFKKNISIIKMNFSKHLSGMIVTKGSEKAILINSTMSLGRQVFTAAHEYYHLKFDNDLNEHKDFKENEANEFASYFLMPETALLSVITERGINKFTINDIIYLEHYFKLSHKALLRRLIKGKYISQKDYDNYSSLDIIETAFKLGYEIDLYIPTNEERTVTSTYAEVAEKALNKKKLSNSKYENYLIEGGYEEIVFGSPIDGYKEELDNEFEDCF